MDMMIPCVKHDRHNCKTCRYAELEPVYEQLRALAKKMNIGIIVATQRPGEVYVDPELTTWAGPLEVNDRYFGISDWKRRVSHPFQSERGKKLEFDPNFNLIPKETEFPPRRWERELLQEFNRHENSTCDVQKEPLPLKILDYPGILKADKVKPKELQAPGAAKDEDWYSFARDISVEDQERLRSVYKRYAGKDFSRERVMNSFANEIVSVQPMTIPTSLVFEMKSVECSHPSAVFKGLALFCPTCDKVVGGI